MKRIFGLILALCLLVSGTALALGGVGVSKPASSAYNTADSYVSPSAASSRVTDVAGLFSASEEAALESRLAQFEQETGMSFGILTTDFAHDDLAVVADDFYDENGFGDDGILYYIDMYNRTPYLSTKGAMIDYMTDERIEAAHEKSFDYLSYGQYANAAMTMIGSVEAYVDRGIPEGQYQHDVVTGRYLTSRHKALTGSEMLVCGLIALVAALLFTKSVQGSYTLKGSTYDYDLQSNATVNMTDTEDDYLRTTTTRVRKAPPPSDNGRGGGGFSPGRSSVHTSSSGSRHGGGAGRSF